MWLWLWCRRVKGLLGPITLRRLKTQICNGRPIVELPKRDVFVEHLTLSDEERRLYDTMQTQGKLIVSKWVSFSVCHLLLTSTWLESVMLRYTLKFYMSIKMGMALGEPISCIYITWYRPTAMSRSFYSFYSIQLVHADEHDNLSVHW